MEVSLLPYLLSPRAREREGAEGSTGLDVISPSAHHVMSLLSLATCSARARKKRWEERGGRVIACVFHPVLPFYARAKTNETRGLTGNTLLLDEPGRLTERLTGKPRKGLTARKNLLKK